MDTLWNTLITGVTAATLGAAFAVLIAYLTARRAVPGHRFLGFLATAPAAIPGIVLGVALFIAYTRPPFQLYGTLWILLLAFLTIEMPPAYQQMQAAFRGLNPELEDASRILGAGRLKSLISVVAPLLKSSVAATWCFVFIGAIRELSATILLTTSDTKLVSVLIYDLNEGGQLGGIAVLGPGADGGDRRRRHRRQPPRQCRRHGSWAVTTAARSTQPNIRPGVPRG